MFTDSVTSLWTLVSNCCSSVGWLFDGRSAIISLKGRELHFPAPFGALDDQLQEKKHWKRNEDKSESLNCSSCDPLYKNFTDIKVKENFFLSLSLSVSL